MSLATLTSKDLSRIQKLVERKEGLGQQIAEINRELEAMESGVSEQERPAQATTRAAARSGKAEAPLTPRKQARRRRKTVRGELKAKIAAQLKSAGNQGMRIKDLAARIGTSSGNVTAFFQSTGKKVKEIKKVGRGQYAWVGT